MKFWNLHPFILHFLDERMISHKSQESIHEKMRFFRKQILKSLKNRKKLTKRMKGWNSGIIIFSSFYLKRMKGWNFGIFILSSFFRQRMKGWFFQKFILSSMKIRFFWKTPKISQKKNIFEKDEKDEMGDFYDLKNRNSSFFSKRMKGWNFEIFILTSFFF